VPFRQDGFVLHTLRLPDDEAALLKSLDRRVRQNVKHAERDGVTVTECRTWKECEAFYDLQVLTRKRLGVPVQPMSFFRAVWEQLIAPGMGFVLVAHKDRIPIAGGVFLPFKSVVYHKYSAADVRYKGFEGPSAVLWGGLQRAIALGCRQVDFGRSAITDTGLNEFKRRWGADETDLPYSIMAGRAPDAAAFHVDGIVRAVIRHAPTFVCRLTGEMFYRHFA
jgi:lipid II:glycine glycyltransferase (peptidoglycan interpeptide bridge formation enzyme)